MSRACVAPLAIAVLAACPGARHPRGPGALTAVEIGREGASLRGVAELGDVRFVALAIRTTSTIEARRGASVAWSTTVGGIAGPLAANGSLLFATLVGTGALAQQAVRGEPGAMVLALDPATGAARWKVPVESSEWAQIVAVHATERGVVIGGAFSGTLRIGASVVSSAGKSDGFVALLDETGQPRWLVRVGGPHADSVQGVDARGGRVAIAGAFGAGAELQGTPLPAFDERVPYADGFVASLDLASGARQWSTSFGGKLDDAVAGVAIDAAENVVVAANARDTVHVGGIDLVAQGDADGMVAWWTRAGVAKHAVLLGGPDFDGLRAIAASADRVIVAGFFSGTLSLGARTLAAGGGDDAFFAALDDRGAVTESWQVGGPGREEITALVGRPAGFIAGVAHTAAASVAGAELPAPKDPMSGAALVHVGSE